ncbi:MAG: MerR family transcriptional regulator [Hyphomicrobium sp.]
MRSADLFLLPSEAAERLGVSTKALRVYEEHGLVTPVRTATGWRPMGLQRSPGRQR